MGAAYSQWLNKRRTRNGLAHIGWLSWLAQLAGLAHEECSALSLSTGY